MHLHKDVREWFDDFSSGDLQPKEPVMYEMSFFTPSRKLSVHFERQTYKLGASLGGQGVDRDLPALGLETWVESLMILEDHTEQLAGLVWLLGVAAHPSLGDRLSTVSWTASSTCWGRP